MDDLVQKLRDHYQRQILDWDLLIDAADALARKDAEIAELRTDRDQARRTSEYWKAEHVAANTEIARLKAAADDRLELQLAARTRAERAEARVREAPRVGVSVIDGEVWVSALGDRKAALVLLDTEEAK